MLRLLAPAPALAIAYARAKEITDAIAGCIFTE